MTSDKSALDLRPGDHVFLALDQPRDYVDLAEAIFQGGRQWNQKCVLFGPDDSAERARLRAAAVFDTDPRVAFLGGAFDSTRMFAMFREQSMLARSQGYDGLRVVADMDWLLPAALTTAQLIAFELMLDRVVREVGATVVCAYRRDSFDTLAVSGNASVHPTRFGLLADPEFVLLADAPGTWRLSGELDLASRPTFDVVIAAAASVGDCSIDMAELSFIDVASMRVLAETARRLRISLRILGASSTVRRCWSLCGFDRLAPTVSLVA